MAFLAPLINEQQLDVNGKPLSGGTIDVFLAGTSTRAVTYSDKAGSVENTNPIVLNSLGVNVQGSVWLTGGAAYKFVIKDASGTIQRTIDNISGINDTTVTTDQWVVYQGEPTYVSATSFTVAGDQTQIFQINRRLKSANTGGTIYSTITNSVYAAPNTTVTVRNDSGTLDSGLSQVSYGVVSVQNSSVSGLLLNVQTFTANGTYTPTPGTTFIEVEAVGGGGGGGGTAATGAGQIATGGGGGGAAYGRGRYTTAFAGLAVTVGAAGTAGAVAGAGGNGGSTSLGTLLVCPGGTGGQTGAAFAPPTFSAAIVGTIGPPTGANLLGTLGSFSGPALSFSTSQLLSGAGGDSFMGSGGQARLNVTAAGLSGNGYGAGGSGGSGGASVAGQVGGAGTGGAMRIYEYA